MARLSQEEREDFLGEPRIAHLVTLRPEGTPHAAPVWFLWDGGKAWVMADGGAIKVRNIHRHAGTAFILCGARRAGEGDGEELGPGR